MNIVIISEYTSRELYIVEQIIRKYPSAVVIQPYSAKKFHQNGVKKKKPRKTVESFINRVTWKLHRVLWDRKFYPQRNFPEIENKVSISFSNLNGPEGVKLLKDLLPDVLITCRAPLLSDELIEIPRIAAVNIHFGLPPEYRGNDTLFWPLYYEDYDRLGGCIHHLTSGVDTGNILAEVYPPLSYFDGEIAVDYKTTLLLAKAALQFLKVTESTASYYPGKAQIHKGRNFRRTDRTFGKSLKYILKRMAGFSGPPKRTGRIVTHFESPRLKAMD